MAVENSSGASITNVIRPGRLHLGVVALLLIAAVASDPRYKLLTYVAYLGALFVLVLSPKDLSRIRIPLGVSVLLALSAGSVVWSIDPRSTILAAIHMVGGLLIGLVAVTRLPGKKLFAVAVRTVRAGLVANYAVIVLLPGWGRVPAEASVIPEDVALSGWRGIFLHKNILGFAMVVTVLICAAAWWDVRRNGGRTRGAALWTAGALGLLLMSNSKTSLVVLIVLLGIGLLTLTTLRIQSRSRAAFLILVSVVGGALAFFVIQNLADIFQLLGKDETLTGRNRIWSAVLLVAHQRPWVGFGLSAIWARPSAVTLQIWHNIGFPVGHAHDGYLDMLLQIGWVGCTALVLSFLAGIRRGWSQARRARDASSLLPVLLLVALLLSNLTETRFLLGLGWILQVVCLLAITNRELTTEATVAARTKAAVRNG